MELSFFCIVLIQELKDFVIQYKNDKEYKKGYMDGYEKGCENNQSENIEKE